MAYVVELDVNAYGFLYGGDEVVSADAKHDLRRPFPPVSERLKFSWEAGSRPDKPNVFQHNLLRDFVCDATALRVLREIAEPDLHVVASGELDGEELTVVQATSILDVVDEERSIPSEYSWARIQFPHIPKEAEPRVERRIFRVANRDLWSMVFFGDAVKAAVEEAGLRGWTFTGAWVEPDGWTLPPP
jgi:hypothetical protein